MRWWERGGDIGNLEINISWCLSHCEMTCKYFDRICIGKVKLTSHLVVRCLLYFYQSPKNFPPSQVLLSMGVHSQLSLVEAAQVYATRQKATGLNRPKLLRFQSTGKCRH